MANTSKTSKYINNLTEFIDVYCLLPNREHYATKDYTWRFALTEIHTMLFVTDNKFNAISTIYYHRSNGTLELLDNNDILPDEVISSIVNNQQLNEIMGTATADADLSFTRNFVYNNSFTPTEARKHLEGGFITPADNFKVRCCGKKVAFSYSEGVTPKGIKCFRIWSNGVLFDIYLNLINTHPTGATFNVSFYTADGSRIYWTSFYYARTQDIGENLKLPGLNDNTSNLTINLIRAILSRYINSNSKYKSYLDR